MAYDQKLDAQRAAMVAALGGASARLSFQELSYQWLGSQGFLQPVLAERMAAYARFYEQEATWAESNMGQPLGPNLATATYATVATFDNVTTPLSVTSFSQTAGTTVSRSYVPFEAVAGRKYEVRYTLDSISAGSMGLAARLSAVGAGATIEVSPNTLTAGQSDRMIFVAPVTGTLSILWLTVNTAVNSQSSAISIRQVN